MGFFGNQSVAGSQPSVHHFRVNSSQYGAIVPVVYGRARIPGIFIWTGDFTATKSKGPGKGLGGSGGSFYTYSVSAQIALAEGPIAGLGRSWHMGGGGLKRHSAAQTNSAWTLFDGAFGQAPWSYLTTRHPGQDLGYSGIACIARSAWNLGTSGAPPQITFEMFGLEPYGGGVLDANPADVIGDILTDPRHGLGLPAEHVADLGDFSDYCVANNFFFSPVFDRQRAMVEWLKMLLECVHSEAVWSNGQLKIVPYGDAPASGNGVTWIPSVGPVYVLDDDDLMAEEGAGPVTVTVVTPADRANVVNVEYINAANDYNIETVEAKDEADIQLLGQRRDSPRQYHPITNSLMARSIAQLKLQRSLHVVNQYEIRVPQRYILAEPMDILGLTDPSLGLSAYPARIVEIEEEADDAGRPKGDSLIIRLEDLGINSTPGYPTQPPGPWGSVDQNVEPNPVNSNPIIFEPPAKALGNHGVGAHLKGALELWVAASPVDADADWGGCNVYLSSDDSTYSLAGRIRNVAAMGTLSAPLPSHGDPDRANTIEVDLSESGGVLTGISHSLADRGMNLAYVGGELICFAEVAAGAGPGKFSLSYLRRGRLGSAISSHAAGTPFAMLGAVHSLDPAILRIPLSNAHIGQTLYLKFASVNTSIDSEQDLSTCTAYSFVVTGAAHRNRVPPRMVKKYKTGKTYAAGACVKPSIPNGFFYQALNAGTSGGTEPEWPLGIDLAVTDSGGITWVAVGSSPELDAGSIETSQLDDTPPPDPVNLSATITKKRDLKLQWSYPSPRPSNFSHFEIRSGASWQDGSILDTTKKQNYLIVDPPPATTTFWVAAVNVAGVACASPASAVAAVPSLPDVSGLIATVTKKGDVLLKWNKPAPMPDGFSAFEIRQGASWAAGATVDTTKQAKYLIADPAPGTATYWVAVLDRAGNYSPSPPSATASVSAPGSVSGLVATVTKKQDLKLSWAPPSPLPAHFKCHEIRQGGSWAAGTFVAHTKQCQFVVHDPPVSTVTYWVGVLDMAGNYDLNPQSVTGSVSAGFSLDVIADGDGSGHGVYGKTRLSALTGGVPNREILHLFPNATLDPDGRRIQVPLGSQSSWLGSAAGYSGNIEVDAVIELAAGGTLHISMNTPASGYDFVVSDNTHCLIVKCPNGFFSAGTVLADFGNTPAGVHHVVCRYHSNGHLSLILDGRHLGTVVDTSYQISGGITLARNPGGQVWVSKISVKGHSHIPADYQDSDQRALVDLRSGHIGKHLGNIADDPASKRRAHVVDVIANRPAPGNPGALFHAIDQGANGATYRDTGTGWKKIGVGHVDDLDEDTGAGIYARTKRTALSGGIPNRETQHLFPGASYDADGRRIIVPTVSAILQSAVSYSKDIEIDAVVELTPGSTLHVCLPNAANNGYDFVLSDVNHCLIVREAGGPQGAATVLADFGNTTPGVHHVTLRRHRNGKLTFILDGNTLGTVRDTTYVPAGRIYLTQNPGGQCYISKIGVRGNPTVAADTIDPSTGALMAGALAAGAATNAGTNTWNSASGIPLSPSFNTFSSWLTTATVGVVVQNNGDVIEGVVEVIFVANIGIYNPGTLSFLEVQIVNDLGSVVCGTPNLIIGDFTRDAATTPSSFSTLAQAATGYVAFSEPTAGSRTYSLQVRFFNGQATAPSATIYRALASLRAYAA